MAGSTANPLRVAISGLSLLLCMFATFYFLVILKTGIVYTHLFYLPIVLLSAWWRRKGVILTFCIVAFLLIINFYFAPDISIVNNLERAAILLFVSIFTSTMFERRKRTEEKLRESEEFLDNVFSSLNDMVMILDRNGKILDINKACFEAHEISREKALGQFCYEVTHHRESPCNSPENPCPLLKVFETGTPQTVVHKHFSASGEPIYVELSFSPMRARKKYPLSNKIPEVSISNTPLPPYFFHSKSLIDARARCAYNRN